MNDYKQKRLAEFDEQIEEMVKQTTYGLICEVCGGGGMVKNSVCEKCEGQGVHTWRTNHLGEKIKSFLATSIDQAVSEEKERVKGWIKAEKATYSEDVAQRERAVYDHIIKCFGEFSSQDKPLDK